jgi:hypothetical protein
VCDWVEVVVPKKSMKTEFVNPSTLKTDINFDFLEHEFGFLWNSRS